MQLIENQYIIVGNQVFNDDEELNENMSMKHCWGQLNSSNTTTMNDRYLESCRSLRKVAYPFLYDDDDD